MSRTGPLTVVLLTYDRFDYAKQTLDSLMKNLKVQSVPLYLHIADDGSPNGYVDELAHQADEGHRFARISHSNSRRSGYGANYNLATQTTHAESGYILPLEDDWELVQEIDVESVLDVLDDGIFGCVRMGYIGYTQSLICGFVWHGHQNWLHFSEFSSEPHVFAGHPRIETVEWSRALGMWPVGITAGETEFEVCKKPESRKKVGWPIDAIHPYGNVFAHIGTERAKNPGEVAMAVSS